MNIINCLKYAVVFILLVNASLEDIKTHKISNRLILYGLAAGFILMFSHFTVTVAFDSIMGFLAGGGILLAVTCISRGGIGMGDVKLMACSGFYLGLYKTLECIAYSIIFCGIFGVVLLFIKGFDRKATVPFAPFIFIGVLTIFIQSNIS